MPRSPAQIAAELIDAALELEGRSRPFVILDELHHRVETLMVHYANIVETERSVQLSQRLDKAIHDVAVTAITGVISLGVGTALAAAASRGATLAAASTTALRLANLTRAADLAARAGVAASEAGTVARTLGLIGRGYAWTNQAVTVLPGCSGLVSPSVFAGMAIVDTVALSATLTGLGWCANMAAGNFVALALGDPSGLRPASYAGVGLEQLHRSPDFEAYRAKVERIAREEAASFFGGWTGFLGMRGPEFHALAQKVDFATKGEIAAASYPKTTELAKTGTRKVDMSFMDLSTTRWVEAYRTEDVYGTQLKAAWESQLTRQQKDELHVAGARALTLIWQALYQQLQQKHQNLRIKVGILENQCRRLGREWGESLAALPLPPARK